jgi:maltose/maltodextrin transport system substrate-binding protein
LLPVALSAFSYKGQLYGYPYDLEAVAFFCHKNLVPKIPEDFAQLFKDYSHLQKPKENRFIFLYDIKNFFFSFPFIAAHGGYVFKETPLGLNAQDVGLANEGALTGFKFIRKLAQDKYIPTSTDRSIAFSYFKEGKVGCTIDGPWALADLRAANIPYTVSPIPKIYGKSPRPFIGAHGLMIRRSSSNVALAQEFIEKYVMTKPGQLSLYKEDPRGPTQLEAIAELSTQDSDLRAFLESAKLGIAMPNIPAMGPVWNAMGTALTRSVESTEDLNKILQDSHSQILTK